MKHPENAYIQAGYKYERSTTPAQTRVTLMKIRALINDANDQKHAQELIEKGRKVARAPG